MLKTRLLLSQREELGLTVTTEGQLAMSVVTLMGFDR
jgi:hypothetical protein